MIDQMAYNYQTGTNKLTHIGDFVADNAFTYDIDNQSANNYTYDAIGNLTQDVKGGLSSIAWNPYGKITQISKGTNGNLYYDYDAMGNRIKKNFTQSNDNADNTWYVRDASGNIMAIYSRKNYGTNQQLLLENYELYGSSRLGLLNLGIPVEGDYDLTPTTNYTRSLGLKQYELSNHLGNVLTTFSDQRVFVVNMSTTNPTALTPKLISAQDYYPFGMIMDGRSWNEDKAKFGFNGKEKDREIYNNESITTALFWEFDGRIGRRWNLDPKPQVFISDYVAFGDNPILCNDLKGDVFDVTNEKAQSDVKSLANKGNDKYIKFDKIDDKYRARLDFGDMSLEDRDKLLSEDKGLSLVNDLINATYTEKSGKDDYVLKDYYFVYDVGDKSSGIKRNTGEIVNVDYVMGQRNFGIVNLSITPRNANGGLGGSDLKPMDNISGFVKIIPGKYTAYSPPYQEVNRASVVFHELMENYARTVLKMPYVGPQDGSYSGLNQPAIYEGYNGAHNYSAVKESSTYGNPTPGGGMIIHD